MDRDKHTAYAVLTTTLGLFAVIIVNKYFGDALLSTILGIIILVIGLLLLPTSLQFRSKNPELINLVISLLTTFLGVYLAIILTNRSTERAEIKKVISLSMAAQKEINQKWGDAYDEVIMIDSLFTDKPDSAFRKYKDFYHKRNIELYKKPNLIYAILENELVLNYFNQHCIFRLSKWGDQMNTIYREINSTDGDFFFHYRAGSDLTVCLEATSGLLQSQIKYLENKISPVELIQEINKIDSTYDASLNSDDWKIIPFDTDYRPITDSTKLRRRVN